MTKTLHLLLTAVLLATAISVSAGAPMYKGYETPQFDVVASDGPFELRSYASHLVAEVQLTGERSPAIRKGFRMLAGFIFGGNDSATKIAMTAPVAQARSDDSWTVQFTMPASYGLDTLPAPNDARIQFRHTEPERLAVIQFSGRWTERQLSEKAELLQRWAADRDLQLEGPPRYYFYDDPFTWPGRRRNEVAFLVR